MAEMKTLNGYEVVDEKARERLNTLVIPTKTSQLENDSQFTNKQYVDTAIETAKPDLTGYATKQELTAVENKIPSLTGYATEAYVDGKIAEIPGTDLSNYYNKTETDNAISTAIAGITIPTKTSELTNDSNFVTETELNNKGYLTSIPEEYVTETELNNKGYLTAVPDTYALKTDIPDVSSFTTMAAVEAKGYQTASDVTTLINNALGVIENGTY